MFNWLRGLWLGLFSKKVKSIQYSACGYELARLREKENGAMLDEYIKEVRQRIGESIPDTVTKNQKLDDLVKTWERRARSKFLSAQLEKNLMGRRLIEHGAFCYFNCAQELKEVLAAPSPRGQEHPSGDQM